MGGFGGVGAAPGAVLGSEVGQLADLLLGRAGKGQRLPKGIFKPILTLYRDDDDDDDDDDEDDISDDDDSDDDDVSEDDDSNDDDSDDDNDDDYYDYY